MCRKRPGARSPLGTQVGAASASHPISHHPPSCPPCPSPLGAAALSPLHSAGAPGVHPMLAWFLQCPEAPGSSGPPLSPPCSFPASSASPAPSSFSSSAANCERSFQNLLSALSPPPSRHSFSTLCSCTSCACSYILPRSVDTAGPVTVLGKRLQAIHLWQPEDGARSGWGLQWGSGLIRAWASGRTQLPGKFLALAQL